MSLIYYLFFFAIGYVLVYKLLSSKNKIINNIMIVFGSGGHTSEILMIFKDFDFTKYANIYFVRASTDNSSEIKALTFIKTNEIKIDIKNIKWVIIPRSREVKQSYFSSIFTTIYSCIYTYIIILKLKKIDLIVTNGPGTTIPVVYSLFINKLLFINIGLKIIFIESFCRVTHLSLTGVLLYYISNKFIVHWEKLANKYKRATYYGKLI